MMVPPRSKGRFRKTAIDHVAAAKIALEQAEAELGRINDALLSSEVRAAVDAIRAAVAAGQAASSDGIVLLLDSGAKPR